MSRLWRRRVTLDKWIDRLCVMSIYSQIMNHNMNKLMVVKVDSQMAHI